MEKSAAKVYYKYANGFATLLKAMNRKQIKQKGFQAAAFSIAKGETLESMADILEGRGLKVSRIIDLSVTPQRVIREPEKPTREQLDRQEIEAAKAVLRKHGYAVDVLWQVADIDHIIEQEESPELFYNVTDAEKLDFLNMVLEHHTETIGDALSYNIDDLLDIDSGIDLETVQKSPEFLRLAKLGVAMATDIHTGKEEVQRIDDPEAFREDYGLDFTPPLLKSDAEAVKVYNENKQQ